MKIVHLITNLEVGGAEMMLYKLLSGIDRQRFQNIVVSMVRIGSVGKKIEALGIPVYTLGMQRSRPSRRALKSMIGVLKKEQPTILQTWMYHADLLGLFAAWFGSVPHTVWNIRCSNMEGMRSQTALILRLCSRLSARPSAVVVNSITGRAVHDALGYRARRWEVIPNGFDLEQFKPDPSAYKSVRAELGIGADTPLIGLLCRYHPMKDHRTFLQAAKHLANTRSDVHFLLAGAEVDCSNPELSHLVADYGLERSVHLLGERHDTPRLLAALDIATSSSAYGEGFSNAIGEAMACGVPCVVTDVGDAAQIVDTTGIVVPPRDPQALAKQWAYLLDAGPVVRRDMGKASRARIQQHYSLEQIVSDYENLYLSL